MKPSNYAVWLSAVLLLSVAACGSSRSKASPSAAAPSPGDKGAAAAKPTAPAAPRMALAQPDLALPEEAEEPKSSAGSSTAKSAEKGPDKWLCEGEVPIASLASEVREHSRQVRNCYEKRLRDNSGLEGDLSVELRIGHNGRVSDVRLQGSLRDAKVRSCVSALTKKWSFPRPSGGTCAVVAAPFHFSPRGA